MKKLDVAYECEFCKKLFKTDKHKCKFNPALKNCFTCYNFDGWELETAYLEEGTPSPPYPICKAENGDGYDIEIIKRMNYNMHCEKWQKR